MKRIATGLVALLLVLSLVGCAKGNTEADEQAVVYNGGSFTSATFDKCMGATKREWFGPGDTVRKYPLGQRTFSFTGKAGSEREPYDVPTKDNVVVGVPGFITFSLTDNCEKLQEFHERMGKKYEAWIGGDGRDGNETTGWEEFLLDYMDVPTAAAMVNAGLDQPEWLNFYTDSDNQTDFELAVKGELPRALEDALGGDYIKVINVTIGKPLPPQVLLDKLTDVQAAKLAKTAQDEQNLANVSKYQTFTDCANAGVSEETCTLIYLTDQGKVPFYPLPVGGNVNINPPAAAK